MRVLASPARRNKDRNPFNFLLSESLAAEDCEVVDLDSRNGLHGGWDVFHIHWPQEAARGSLRVVRQKIPMLVLSLIIQRMWGAQIVWTVHNVHGHDQNNPRLERALMRFVARIVHGVIFLTASSREAAYREMPILASKPYAIIPHGLYDNKSELTREEARSSFGLPANGPIVGFLGDIKRYKGLDLLLAAFGEIAPGTATLFIAGVIPSRSHGVAVRAELARLLAQGHSIVFREERLDTPGLADAIRACNAVALPYRAVWNSGLALLVLENRVQVLAADAPSFRELQRELGSGWVHIFEGRLTGRAIQEALSTEPDQASLRIDDFRKTRSWPEIGAKTVAFYRRLGARSAALPTDTSEPASGLAGSAGHASSASPEQ